MYALSKKPEPEWKTLIPAQGETPAVRVLFAPVGAKALRLARRAVADVLRSGVADANEAAGDAFTEALLRAGMLEWDGIGDDDQNPIQPTPDVDIIDGDGKVIGVTPGTVSAFLAEPRLVEAADREYVLPWARRDAEKNGYAPSLSGTSAGATPAPNTAGSPARPVKTADAVTKKPTRRRAPTKSTNRKRTPAKKSGT
jgi:hypothetical protein